MAKSTQDFTWSGVGFGGGVKLSSRTLTETGVEFGNNVEELLEVIFYSVQAL